MPLIFLLYPLYQCSLSYKSEGIYCYIRVQLLLYQPKQIDRVNLAARLLFYQQNTSIGKPEASMYCTNNERMEFKIFRKNELPVKRCILVNAKHRIEAKLPILVTQFYYKLMMRGIILCDLPWCPFELGIFQICSFFIDIRQFHIVHSSLD